VDDTLKFLTFSGRVESRYLAQRKEGMIWMIRMGGGKTEDRGQRTEDRRQRSEGQKWPRFHSTFDIIEVVEAGKFPDKAMLTVHPQRWTDDRFQWTKELVWQNCKNLVKRILVSRAETQRRRGEKIRS